MNNGSHNLQKISSILTSKKMTLAIAESCTGGLISHTVTNKAGSSCYFLLGMVAYANQAKTKLLKVPDRTIQRHGAVSKETALAMARGVKSILDADIGLSVTGIAGPAGGTRLKPVGTVFIAVSSRTHSYYKKFLLSGSRTRIKNQTRDEAFKLLSQCLTLTPNASL